MIIGVLAVVAVLTRDRALVAAQPFIPPETCIGDRDDDGVVSVSELTYGIRIALGAGSDFCGVFDADQDRRVGINDLVAAVDDALRGCGALRRVDLAAFQEFHFMRTPAFGFCPPPNAVFQASIERDDGGLLLQIAMLEDGQPDVDECLPNVFPDDRCLVVRNEPSRYLRTDEVARVTDIFASVAVRDAPISDCRGCSIDPCVINTMVWDSLHTTDYVCNQFNRIDKAQTFAIIDMLEMLRDDE